MKFIIKRFVVILLIVLSISLLVSNTMLSIVAETTQGQTSNSTVIKTLYRYRERVESTTRYPLESPWMLISQTSSMQFYMEYNKLNPQELSQVENNYAADHYYITKVSDGSCVKYTTNPHGTGTAYYFDEALPDYGMF